jgi:biopolymer transport protein ExbD
MAGLPSAYSDDEDGGAITDINITPFVDVVLVLLVIFIVTARLIVARGIEVDKPKEAAGGDIASTLRVQVTRDGKLAVNNVFAADDAAALERIKEAAARMTKPKAIITGDRNAAYGGVMHAMALVHSLNIPIALENERPKQE